jgi:hypothetical protein
MKQQRIPVLLPLMGAGMIALLAGMWAGLFRLGWTLPPLRLALPMAHGPLMVSGFLGLLMGVERAIALKHGWTYVSPLLTGLGALALIIGMSVPVGPVLITLGSLGLTAVFVVIVRRHMALYTVTMGLGALAWLIGSGLWLIGWPVHRVVLWWVAFLVLTIAGERLELARILRPSRASFVAFLIVAGLFLVGIVTSTFAYGLGVRLAGLGMIGLALWLLLYDIARHTVRKRGLPRFIAVCLLSGYAWLAAGGAMGVIFGGVAAGPRYDATLHAVFLGFVVSMIFGHAPIVFPAVLGVPLAYHPSFYLPLVLLHLSLVLRVVGDLIPWWPGRQWGGLLNAVAILLFVANTARTIRGARLARAGS